MAQVKEVVALFSCGRVLHHEVGSRSRSGHGLLLYPGLGCLQGRQRLAHVIRRDDDASFWGTRRKRNLPISTDNSVQGWTGMCTAQFGRAIAYSGRGGRCGGTVKCQPGISRTDSNFPRPSSVISTPQRNVRLRRTIGGLSSFVVCECSAPATRMTSITSHSFPLSLSQIIPQNPDRVLLTNRLLNQSSLRIDQATVD